MMKTNFIFILTILLLLSIVYANNLEPEIGYLEDTYSYTCNSDRCLVGFYVVCRGGGTTCAAKLTTPSSSTSNICYFAGSEWGDVCGIPSTDQLELRKGETANLKCCVSQGSSKCNNFRDCHLPDWPTTGQYTKIKYENYNYEGFQLDDVELNPIKIAYLCRKDICDDGIEDELINWFQEKGLQVTGKKYKNWKLNELLEYDLIVCSDEVVACRVKKGSDIYKAYKDFKIPLMEIPDKNSAKAANSFRYVIGSGASKAKKTNFVYVTNTNDPITSGLPEEFPIFYKPEKMTVFDDRKLKSSSDLIDADSDNKKSLVFKVEQDQDHGKFLWLGWFSDSAPLNLNVNGEILLKRIINWAAISVN